MLHPREGTTVSPLACKMKILFFAKGKSSFLLVQYMILLNEGQGKTFVDRFPSRRGEGIDLPLYQKNSGFLPEATEDPLYMSQEVSLFLQSLHLFCILA